MALLAQPGRQPEHFSGKKPLEPDFVFWKHPGEL
jgi:hypothetical protein